MKKRFGGVLPSKKSYRVIVRLHVVTKVALSADLG